MHLYCDLFSSGLSNQEFSDSLFEMFKTSSKQNTYSKFFVFGGEIKLNFSNKKFTNCRIGGGIKVKDSSFIDSLFSETIIDLDPNEPINTELRSDTFDLTCDLGRLRDKIKDSASSRDRILRDFLHQFYPNGDFITLDSDKVALPKTIDKPKRFFIEALSLGVIQTLDDVEVKISKNEEEYVRAFLLNNTLRNNVSRLYSLI